jgi:hypothetical protein
VNRRSRVLLAAGFVAAATARLAWLAAFEDNWDMGTYRQFVETAPRGADLYRHAPYHYSALWAFALVGLARIAAAIGAPFVKVVGALLHVVDAATAFVLYRIARDRLGRTPESAAAAALLFFANPVSVFMTGHHQQWDSIAILCLLVAVWRGPVFASLRSVDRVETRSPSLRSNVASGDLTPVFWLSLSVLVKHVAFFHPLLFAVREKRRAAVVLYLTPYAVFLASFAPYWAARDAVVEGVFRYRSLAEDYGTAMLAKLPGVPDWAPTALFGVLLLTAVFLLRDVEIGRACLMLFLVQLLLVPGVVEYYFAWPIALGSLYAGAGYAVFTLVVSLFFLGSPDGLGLPIAHLPGWHGVWWAGLLWLMWEIRRSARA